jgi:hypothetical protein
MMPQTRTPQPNQALPPPSQAPTPPTQGPTPPSQAPSPPPPVPGVGGPGAYGTDRSGEMGPAAAPTVSPAATPARADLPRVGAAGVIPYLAVLVGVIAGVYITWHQGSHGGGQGGVIAGAAFLVAAIIRLVLPAKLAGLLASRHRTNDVVTLVIFGASLLILGLVLPRLGSAIHTARTAGRGVAGHMTLTCV